MDEDDIDALDLSVKPKTVRVYKSPQLEPDASLSRRTEISPVDNVVDAEVNDELRSPELTQEIKLKPIFRKKPVQPNQSSSRRTGIGSIDDGAESEVKEEPTFPTIHRVIKLDPKFRRKQVIPDVSSSRSRRVSPIDNKPETEESNDNEDVQLNIKPSLTFQRRDPNESSKRRLNLSKYKVSHKNDEEVIEQTGGESVKEVPNDQPLNEDLLEFDNDPENNPVIANIDTLDFAIPAVGEFSFRRDFKVDSPRSPSDESASGSRQSDNIDTSQPSNRFASNNPSYVPIASNAEPSLSKREYLNQIASEYNDDKNYDDGAATSSSLNQELRQQQPDYEAERNHDYELNDEDMGVLKHNVDFENKYNDEIVSDYGSGVSDGDYDYDRYGSGYGPRFGSGHGNGYGYNTGYNYQRMKPKPAKMKVYTIQEQIDRIEQELKLQRAKRMQKEVKRGNVLKRKDEIQQKREALVKKLEDWEI
ncbi:hypothetical protein CANMA_002596 [Candida margitis]|uniref:uncharacterized protein n=1 Tax=Candida margitis TaxID=1775924 RepID=UPI002226B238|nr:uncharacterized protein CANMA_002596 [Candida margitis]KAI5968094.1 hypothetical protein CANMA_002596 [Candida margitis]